MKNSQCAIHSVQSPIPQTALLPRTKIPFSLRPVNAKEFSDRLWDFAVEIARLVEALPDGRVGRHVAAQLLRCGTSAAPNYDEGCDAESRKDFAHKLGIAAKEMRETSGWLGFAHKMSLVPAPQISPLLAESIELRKMLGRSLITVRGRIDRAR